MFVNVDTVKLPSNGGNARGQGKGPSTDRGASLPTRCRAGRLRLPYCTEFSNSPQRGARVLSFCLYMEPRRLPSLPLSPTSSLSHRVGSGTCPLFTGTRGAAFSVGNSCLVLRVPPARFSWPSCPNTQVHVHVPSAVTHLTAGPGSPPAWPWSPSDPASLDMRLSSSPGGPLLVLDICAQQASPPPTQAAD